MKVITCILLSLFIPATSICNVVSDSLLHVLKKEILRKKTYDQQKESRLLALKVRLSHIPPSRAEERFAICNLLYWEYKDYVFDSAHVYTRKLLSIANQLHSLPWQYASQIKLANIQVSCGMFKEAFDGIQQMNPDSMATPLKFRYYELKSQAYTRLAIYNSNKFYSPVHRAESIEALDSAMKLAQPGSYEKLGYIASYYRNLKQDQRAEDLYRTLLKRTDLSAHQRAMAIHDLSSLSTVTEKKALLTQAAIYDIRSSTKETLAIFSLASILLKEGNSADAEILLNEALAQAIFYGNKLHQEEVNNALKALMAHQLIERGLSKNSTLSLLIIVLVIAISGTGITFYAVYKKLLDVRRREAAVNSQNLKLDELNQELSQLNKQLSEDSSIKEEYIGYFFKLISAYILRLEKIKRSTEKSVRNENFKELAALATNIDIKKERSSLFHTFDTIFLKLFPNFISSFNSLLAAEDQIVPKKSELLNTNLRIFALMRLGIKDNQTIANILESKVTTIYTYKFRIKSRALVAGNDFDKKIMEIKFSSDFSGEAKPEA